MRPSGTTLATQTGDSSEWPAVQQAGAARLALSLIRSHLCHALPVGSSYGAEREVLPLGHCMLLQLSFAEGTSQCMRQHRLLCCPAPLPVQAANHRAAAHPQGPAVQHLRPQGLHPPHPRSAVIAACLPVHTVPSCSLTASALIHLTLACSAFFNPLEG